MLEATLHMNDPTLPLDPRGLNDDGFTSAYTAKGLRESNFSTKQACGV